MYLEKAISSQLNILEQIIAKKSIYSILLSVCLLLWFDYTHIKIIYLKIIILFTFPYLQKYILFI